MLLSLKFYFVVMLLIKVLNKMLDDMEILLIKIYDTHHNGYNLTDGGGGIRGYKLSDEAIVKISERQYKSVCKYTLDGKLIKLYQSVKCAAEENKCNQSAIASVCRGLKPQHKGYYWQYYDGTNNHNLNINKKYHNPPHYIVQYDIDGNYVGLWNSIRDASNYFGIDNSSIAKVCRGERKSAGGYKWKMITTYNDCVC